MGNDGINLIDLLGQNWFRRRGQDIATAARYTGAYATGFVTGLSDKHRTEYWADKMYRPDTTMGQLVAGDIYDPDGIGPLQETLKPDLSTTATFTYLTGTYSVVHVGKECYQFCFTWSPTKLAGAGVKQNVIGKSRSPMQVYVKSPYLVGVTGGDGSANVAFGKWLGSPVGIEIKIFCTKINDYDFEGCPCPEPQESSSNLVGFLNNR